MSISAILLLWTAMFAATPDVPAQVSVATERPSVSAATSVYTERLVARVPILAAADPTLQGGTLEINALEPHEDRLGWSVLGLDARAEPTFELVLRASGSRVEIAYRDGQTPARIIELRDGRVLRDTMRGDPRVTAMLAAISEVLDDRQPEPAALVEVSRERSLGAVTRCVRSLARAGARACVPRRVDTEA